MQTATTTRTVKPADQRKGLHERWATVQSWCLARGINQVYAFFKGCDPMIAAHETRIRYVLRNTHALELGEPDAMWITSMEATMHAINNRKAA